MISMMKKTKIICTLGPATTSVEVIKELMLGGMDIARLNFSHECHKVHSETISKIKRAREAVGLPIAILLDTKGPEIRTGAAKDGKEYTLVRGQEITVTTKDVPCESSIISVTYQNLPQDVAVGGSILIADGLVELKVTKLIDDTSVMCEVINGGDLGSKKGVNLPNVKLQLPPITEQDRSDIIFGINEGVDFIAASFIRNAAAITEIRKIIKDCNSDISIIAKIENMEGVENIDEIIEAADGIMVARGDLGVEVDAATLPYIQKSIIQKCNRAMKPVITATQMLDSMIRNPRPTRAEVTDVANAIYDGTDAIMLSGETAAGKYPVEAVKLMSKIALETEGHYDFFEYDKKFEVEEKSENISCAISYSAVATSVRLDAKLIIASSFSGYTARLVSKNKPKAAIVGLSPLDRTLRKMQIYRGVQPLKVQEVNSTDHLLEEAVHTVKEAGLVDKGDVVILTAGVPAGKSSVTNMIRAVVID